MPENVTKKPAAQPPTKPRKSTWPAPLALCLGLAATTFGALMVLFAFLWIGHPALFFGMVAGLLPLPWGIVTWRTLKRKGDPGARTAGFGALLGGLGILLFVATIALYARPLGPHALIDDEPMFIEPKFAHGQVFGLNHTSSVHYSIVSAHGDRFTACLIEDGRLKEWLKTLITAEATGRACSCPASSGSGTASLAPGRHSLAVYCWNESETCRLTVNVDVSDDS